MTDHAEMDMESLYDYGEEEQDFYEESPGTRKGYPIDHRSIKRDARGVGSYLGGGSISDGGGMLTVMAKLMKQELASDAEEEGLVPALSGRFTSMRKVPSLSDLSDPESSLGKGKTIMTTRQSVIDCTDNVDKTGDMEGLCLGEILIGKKEQSNLDTNLDHATRESQAAEGGPGTNKGSGLSFNTLVLGVSKASPFDQENAKRRRKLDRPAIRDVRNEGRTYAGFTLDKTANRNRIFVGEQVTTNGSRVQGVKYRKKGERSPVSARSKSHLLVVLGRDYCTTKLRVTVPSTPPRLYALRSTILDYSRAYLENKIKVAVTRRKNTSTVRIKSEELHPDLINQSCKVRANEVLLHYKYLCSHCQSRLSQRYRGIKASRVASKQTTVDRTSRPITRIYSIDFSNLKILKKEKETNMYPDIEFNRNKCVTNVRLPDSRKSRFKALTTSKVVRDRYYSDTASQFQIPPNSYGTECSTFSNFSRCNIMRLYRAIIMKV
ncbi:hypothetical protein WN51_05712 [Melipona quadrifasciata]|uniref:Uncharacterized protein n=1 Tax=Melipona quadrifasciata TaxID=166423 RepID=A0A0M9A749_9HYME|nr:hypothetical protein WN51_05712 [Melipona quadrifasciata]